MLVGISGNVSVTVNNTTTNPAYITGAVTISNTVTITGAVTVSGAVTVTGSVSITGAVTVNGAVTVSGAVSVTGTVSISGGVTVNGSVSITGGVTINGAVSISGGITVSNSVLNIAGSVKAILSNSGVLLSTQTIAFTAGAQATQSVAIVGNLDTSAYASLLITMTVQATTGVAILNTNYMRLIIEQFDITNSSYTPYHIAPEWLLADRPGGLVNGQIQIPVVGNRLYYVAQWGKAATAAGSNIVINVYGSNQVLTDEAYLNNGSNVFAGLAGGGLYTSGDVAGACDVVTQINSANSVITANTIVRAGSGTGTASLRAYSGGNGYLIAGVSTKGLAFGESSMMVTGKLPMLPLAIRQTVPAGLTMLMTIF